MEFVNREEELAFLNARLPPESASSSLTIIRAPSGFGKSELTTQLLASRRNAGFSVAIIDPDIRTRAGDLRIYDGYFLQRAAADLSGRSADPGSKHESFQAFLGRRRWRTAKDKKVSDLVRTMPSFKIGYEAVLDYFERVLGLGRYSAGQILISDSRQDVRLCAEYLQEVAATAPTVFVVREAHHIDHESLRFFLELNRRIERNYLFIEYTTDTGAFDPGHQKLILRELDAHGNAHILDLRRLERWHLERLIRRYAGQNVELSSTYYLNWDGNLCSVIELRYQVALGRRIQTEQDVADILTDLSAELSRHLDELSPEQRLFLALVGAHREPIDRRTIFAVAGRINPHVPRGILEDELRALVDIHGFVAERENRLSFRTEDVAEAVDAHPSLRGLLALAQSSLRDFYLDVIRHRDFRISPMPLALRHALSLSSRTGDVTALIHITEQFSEDIRAANDQSIYVDVVLDAVTGQADLFPEERGRLVDWASALGYEASDFRRAAALVETLPAKDSFQRALLACCYAEIGRHDEAVALASSIRSEDDGVEASLVSDLIDLIVARCHGDRERTARVFHAIIKDRRYLASPNRGYALRFAEFVSDFPTCTALIQQSIDWFGRCGFRKSQAYSELAAAMHTARSGAIETALALVDRAGRRLRKEVRDQHILANNRAAVLLLSDSPDLGHCEALLAAAARSARDDYSDLVILNNFMVTHGRLGRIQSAVEYAERAFKILLGRHDFGDKDVYWPVCFNAAGVFEAADLPARAAETLAIPPREAWRPISHAGYWLHRYGLEPQIEPKYRFLMALKFYPLFLSHWLVDLEGLALLRRERPQ